MHKRYQNLPYTSRLPLIVAEIHKSPNTASSTAEPEMSLIIYSVQQNKWAFCAFSLNTCNN